jgi:hypothetical protein
MLKPAQPAMQPGDGIGRPVGELDHLLVDEGKAYAQAELGLVKAIAASKAQSFKVPAILLGTAFLCLVAAFSVLGIALFAALLPLMPPLLAGLLAFLIFAGIAGGLGYLAVSKIGGAQ